MPSFLMRKMLLKEVLFKKVDKNVELGLPSAHEMCNNVGNQMEWLGKTHQKGRAEMEKIQLMVIENSEDMRKMVKETEGAEEQDRILEAPAVDAGIMAKLSDQKPNIMLLYVNGEDELEMQNSSNSKENVMPIDVNVLSHADLMDKQLDESMQYFILKPVRREHLSRYINQHNRARQIEGPRYQTIEAMCLRVGIPPHIQGYQYIHTAIEMILDKPFFINRITKELYPGIAEQHDTTASKVERSIRHAVEVVWSRGNVEAINDVFGFTVCTHENKPTNGEFIALLANRCKDRG